MLFYVSVIMKYDKNNGIQSLQKYWSCLELMLKLIIITDQI